LRAVEGAATPGGYQPGGVAPGGSAPAGSTAAGGEGLRPLSVGETLDVALKVYRQNAVSLWKIVATIIIPIYIIDVIVRRLTLPSDVFVHNGQLYTFTTNGSSGGTSGTVALILVALLGLFGQLLSHGASFKLVLDSYLGRTADVRQSFDFAAHRLMSLLWLSIIATIAIVIGFILVILPGIWLLVSFSVAVPVLMLEGLTGFKALGRSMSLVRGRWWATFGRELSVLLMYIVALIVIGIIAGAIERGINITNVTLYVIVAAIFQGLIVILVTPFVAAAITVIYIDLRVRKEALDIELLASRFGGPGSTVPEVTSPAAVASAAGLSGDEPPSAFPSG
jgi:hypothetical protein